MAKTALKVEDVSILFNLSKENVDNLKELLIKKIKGEPTVSALLIIFSTFAVCASPKAPPKNSES